ncbi:MAG: phosphoglycerate mutase [Nanoarchaeota archaeon]|nr:phosphoglycerate mutase [Nanoarchaeota archaeon]
MKKLLFIVIDGGADTPHPDINGRTAFEAANIPNIDFLARNGRNGVLRILPVPPESDEAVLSLLGYDVFKVYTGRGPLEAVGGGVRFKDGDLALRCNFGTVEGDTIVNIRAGGLTPKEAKELERAIKQYVSLTDAEYEFKATAGYRGVLVIKSREELSPKISNTHPAYKLHFFDVTWSRDGFIKSIPLSEALSEPVLKLQKCVPLEKSKAAATSARLVNEFIEKSRLVLETHPINKRRVKEGKPPANIVLVRDAGTALPKLYNLSKTFGVRWASFVDMPVERGIAQLTGMDVIPIPPLSGDARKDMTIRVLTLLKNLNFYDAFYIHLKGPDEFAHLKDIEGKIKSIEAIDEYFFRPLLKNIDLMNTIVVVTCDHTTSTEKGIHTNDPVPITIFGSGLPDHIPEFSEKSCSKGSLGSTDGRRLMGYLMKLIK